MEVLKTSQKHLGNHLEAGWLLGKVETSKNLAVFLEIVKGRKTSYFLV